MYTHLRWTPNRFLLYSCASHNFCFVWCVLGNWQSIPGSSSNSLHPDSALCSRFSNVTHFDYLTHLFSKSFALRIRIPFQVQLLTFKALKVPAPIYLQLLIGIYFLSWLETQLWITPCLFPQHPVCSVDVSISQMQSYP